MSVAATTTPVVFDVAGMDCADCARSVERVVGTLPGVDTAKVNFATGTLVVQPNPSGTELDGLARAIGGAVDRAGYTATMRVAGELRRGAERPWWSNRKLVPTIIAAALWVVAFIALHTFDAQTLSTVLFSAAIAVGAWPIVRAAFASLQVRRLDMNVLMTISVIGAAALGDWSEGALVVVLFSLGTTMQAITFDRTRSAIRQLLDQAPEEATLVRDGVEMTVAASTLEPGALVRVKPGDRLPADGRILEGHSAIQEAAITGESLPVDKQPGSDVFAGTLNGQGNLLVEVIRPVSDSMLARIVHMVEDAQATRAPSQQLVDRFAAIYTPAVVILAVLLALGGWLVTDDASTWVYRALVLLVIACPCALVISTPVSIVSAIGAATRMGILVKGGAALEDMARVRTIAFDKTGTLTIGRPAVTAVIPFGTETGPSLLSLAAAVEAGSEHPIGRAIVSRAMHDAVPIPPVTNFAARVGEGAEGEIAGRRIAIGGDRLLARYDLAAQDRARVATIVDDSGSRGELALVVLEAGLGSDRVVGVIVVADRTRSGAAAVVSSLRKAGIRSIAMLTGDRPAVAATVGAQTGVDTIRAGLLPDQKSAAIAELRRQGPVAMVGDGINDAPALAAADVGIAMGLGGTDVALESADIALMRDDLTALPSLVRLANRTLAVIRQNVTLSMVTKLAALILASFGFVNLWIAVLVDVGTSLVVTLNGLRLARLEAEAAQSTKHPRQS